MNFESIPNEVLLELFDYFDDVELLRSFDSLNSRFNDLLYNQWRFHRLNFKSVIRHTFEMICRRHLPLIAERLIALSLSAGKENPHQIRYFCSLFPSFSPLTQLRSLTIFNIHSSETMLQITQRCAELISLTHLKFHSCYVLTGRNLVKEILDNIWSLPKLSHFELDVVLIPEELNNWRQHQTIISTSLKSLSLPRNIFRWKDFNQIFFHAPGLSHLTIRIFDDYYNQSEPSFDLFPLLHTLKIIWSESRNPSELMLLFHNTPNLRQLDITLAKIFTGQQWENIIENYLPKLQVFRLQMQDTIRCIENINELINSFRSPFWIDERQWFIRCSSTNDTVFLHTLPSTFQYFYIEPPQRWITTAPYNTQQEFDDNITGIINERYFKQVLSPDTQMRHLRQLCIRLPIPNQFWTIVPSLTRLDSLFIEAHNDKYRDQLQTLLDRATHLRSLCIKQDSVLPLQTAIFTYTNASVRRFQIQGCRYYFTQEECQQLILSPIGSQCDVLSVIVQDRRSVVYLVKKLINLRLLYVRCKDDRILHEYSYTTYDKKLVPWLQRQLPSTCTVIRDSDDTSRIRIYF